MQRYRLFALLLCALTHGRAQQIYPATDALPRSTDFSVRVRTSGGPWKDLPVYGVKVADGNTGLFHPEVTNMAYFDFTDSVEVAVTPRRAFSNVRIRPALAPRFEGRTIRFTLSGPRNLSIELDGDIFHNLQLFAGAPETAAPDSNTLYYAPGVHIAGTVHLTSGQHVYLAGGAVVEGQFLIDHQHDVRISGRGILFQPGTPGGRDGRHDALLVQYSQNVDISGIIVLPATYTVLMGNSRHVTIRGIKSFSAGGNNDGIDIFCSEDVLVDSVFMRNSDDCIAIYGHRWDFYGNVRDITVSHSCLWADVAHPILVGTHGDPAHPDTLEGLHFLDLDILDHHENQIDYQGCMSLNAGDSNLIRHVRFEDIRVSDFRKGQLVNLRIMFNHKYNTAPGRGISDVLFKNVSYTGSHANLSIIAGYDDNHLIRNVTFQNLRINGKVISDNMPGKPAWYKTSDFAGFFVGEHVDGLKFEAQ
ncbi:glycosyl hydrolase family 28 protein [Dinghuibacter silviterrae]|uniref:Glycosyl hydrolase family 28 n=1 Tax=Dinghuibacter silviterrae TaxID=1539049 RepID=A0A4R8DFW6_9BACT|nr:glycosyl hydrolase family 28 protein [Dinghuibacter silviterrae]TDW96238.1 glycosyl hydrolase family 28 [Dinghuibacter silviterrae]